MENRLPGRSTILIDALLIFLMTAALIWPLFKTKYLKNWASIESTFISDARFLKEHWPHPRWQPLWYCGTRFDYIYPPALRYGTAGLTKIFPIIPARAYHLYTAFFYCVGIAAVYLFIRIASKSRASAWLGAAAAALLSPSFLLFTNIRNDAYPWFLPQRLGALIRYGEGPHMTAFAILPLALAAAWIALQKNAPISLALAALLCALVVSNNFYGATALAILFPILLWSLWITRRNGRMGIRAIAIVLLAYGLTAFWLVPSYLKITISNLQYVSQPGNPWSLALALGAAAVYVLASARAARDRPELAYSVFVWGAFITIGLDVIGNHFFNFRVIGEPGRLIPELDLVIILLAIQGLRWAWSQLARYPSRLAKAGAIAAGLLLFIPSRTYVAHAWEIFQRDPVFDRRIEYRLTDWVSKHLPGSRTMATGSLRFWYNAWHDLAQLGGGSEQGLLNGAVMPAQWQIMLGETAESAIQWMLCMGIDAVIVHDKTSQEIYHDFAFPQKFAGVLPVIYDDQEGNIIYRIPRRFPGLGRVVNRERYQSLKPIQSDSDLENLRAYADTAEKGPNSPVNLVWEGTDAMRIHANVNPGESLLLQESYDPAWRAYSGGQTLAIQKDVLGFMRVDAPPGEHDLRVVFELPFENLVGRIITGLSLSVVLVLLAMGVRQKAVRR